MTHASLVDFKGFKSEILPSDIHCVVCDTNDLIGLDWSSFLHEDEYLELKNRNASARAGSLTARYALKSMLCEKFRDTQGKRYSAHTFMIQKNPLGAPFIYFNKGKTGDVENATPMNDCVVSLSHSGTLGAAGLTNEKYTIGIDVEFVRPFADDTARAFLTPLEYRFIVAQGRNNRDALLTTHWCLKEAYLKALGVGLRIHPGRISVHFSHGRQGGKISIFQDGARANARAFWTAVKKNAILSCVVLPRT